MPGDRVTGWDVYRRRAAGRPLTGREVEVLRLVADGLSNEEIGRVLFLSPETVRTHLRRMAAKLGIRSVCGPVEVSQPGRSRVLMVAAGFRQGLLE